jgi:putative flippase GtrA
MYRKVDPAALLFAIFTVAVSPLTTVGPWDKMNTIVAGVVGTVLLAFTWPRKETLQDESNKIAPVDSWMTAAQAIAYGLVVTIGTAWIVQEAILKAPEGCPPYFDDADPPKPCTEVVEIAGHATYWALGIGAVAAVVLFFWMRRRIEQLVSSPPAPPP